MQETKTKTALEFYSRELQEKRRSKTGKQRPAARTPTGDQARI